jgi:hypothetical protein
MPLSQYGVLVGTKVGYYRDQPNNFGKYFHGHIDVQTPNQLYNTAIDVDSQPPKQVQWKVIHLRSEEWQDIFTLADGYHPLASNGNSGAVDYYRDLRLRTYIFGIDPPPIEIPWWKSFPPFPWIKRIPERLNVLLNRASVNPSIQLLKFSRRLIDVTPPWNIGNDIQALADLEAMLVDASRVVIFGEFYPAKNGKPPGLHDIHQNQGDPAGSQWWNLSGIWQDGLTIAIHSDGTASAFMNKFNSQVEKTDDNGHPI